jgi:predicted secreted protein
VRGLPIVLASLALAAAATGCGSGEREPGDAASLAPAGARLVMEVDGDLDSGQWRAALELASRFPDADGLLDKLRELDAVAGDRAVLVALEGDVVALTQPDDAGKLRSLVAEHRLATREVAGWTAVAKDAGSLDRYEQALDRGTLEGDEAYEAARATFPEEALATAYARGDEAFEWLALAVTAEEEGLRAAGRLRVGTTEAQAVAPELLDEVPADALAAVAFGGGPSLPELPGPFGSALRPIAELLAEGGVVWVRPGLLIPEVTALLPSAGVAEADRLLRELAEAVSEPAELEGRPAKRVRAGPVTITYAEIDGRLVVTTAGALGGSGRLVDDPDFREAREAAGMPERVNGLLYVDVHSIAPLLGLLGELDAAPHGFSRNLEQVSSVLAFSAGEGQERELGLFVGVG